MDNFVTQLIDNINIDSFKGNRGSGSRYRELLYYISVSNPEIDKIDGCDRDGDVQFEVSMKSLGISYDLMVKYKKEVCSDFIANFLGELLIRENINSFAKVIMSIKPELYPSMVNRFEHRKFGMNINREKLVFSFHVSLLQKIMLEDVKRQIK